MPSTVIRWLGYHAAERRLEILFTTGRRYSYHDVRAELANAMRQSFSKGEFFNAHIRDHFQFTREASATPPEPHLRGNT
jgi:lysyl-tRNA synthetase class 2